LVIFVFSLIEPIPLHYGLVDNKFSVDDKTHYQSGRFVRESKLFSKTHYILD